MVFDYENGVNDIENKQKEAKDDNSNNKSSPIKSEKRKKFLNKPKVANAGEKASKNNKSKNGKNEEGDPDSPNYHIKEALKQKMRQ